MGKKNFKPDQSIEIIECPNQVGDLVAGGQKSSELSFLWIVNELAFPKGVKEVWDILNWGGYFQYSILLQIPFTIPLGSDEAKPRWKRKIDWWNLGRWFLAAIE